MVTFPLTLTDPNPVFKVTAFLKSNISKTVRFRDKVTNDEENVQVKTAYRKMESIKSDTTISQKISLSHHYLRDVVSAVCYGNVDGWVAGCHMPVLYENG